MRHRQLGFVFFILLPTLPLRAEERKIIPSDFISTQDGHLPLILSAPHGGDIRIPGISDRKGEGLQRGGAGFAIVRDSNTEELAHALSQAIEAKFGQKPYFVIARFQRKQIDPNRPATIAYEDPKAKPIYDLYHQTLAHYCTEVKTTYGRGLLLDLHGQSAAKDTIFRGTQNGKTVTLLVQRYGEKAHIGPQSFFGLLTTQGLKGFPLDNSPEHAGFTGGYIVQTYGNAEFGIDAIQLEFGGDFRAKDKLKDTAAKLTDIIAAFSKLYLPDKPIEKPVEKEH